MDIALNECSCNRCNSKWSDANRLFFCNKVLVCEACCKGCPKYNKAMLPNGTHCLDKYYAESRKYRLLARPIKVSPEKLAAAKSKYEAERYTGRLFEKFCGDAELYRLLKDESARAKLLIELAGMQAVLLERTLSEPRTRRLFVRLTGYKTEGSE